MGSRVSRPTGRTSFSVISAKASAALRWRSTLSEKESVVRAVSGDPWKKLVVVRSGEGKIRDLGTMNVPGAYSQDTVAGRRLLHVHFPRGGVRIAGIYVNGLREVMSEHEKMDICAGHAQQESQQLLTTPIVEEGKRALTCACGAKSKSKTLRAVGTPFASCRCSNNPNPNPNFFPTTMAEPSWQEQIRLRLAERNVKQNAFASIIEQCLCLISPISTTLIPADRRLAQQTKLLKERNASLLKAVGSVRANPSSSTVYIPGTASGEEYVTPSHTPPLLTRLGRNPVRAAYMTSLESQISSLRDELASVYKTQGQNAQRLLAMNETLREKEELSRIESESLRKAREEIDRLRRKVDQHNELMMEKDRTAQVSARLFVSSLVRDPLA